MWVQSFPREIQNLPYVQDLPKLKKISERGKNRGFF